MSIPGPVRDSSLVGQVRATTMEGAGPGLALGVRSPAGGHCPPETNRPELTGCGGCTLTRGSDGGRRSHFCPRAPLPGLPAQPVTLPEAVPGAGPRPSFPLKEAELQGKQELQAPGSGEGRQPAYSPPPPGLQGSL